MPRPAATRSALPTRFSQGPVISNETTIGPGAGGLESLQPNRAAHRHQQTHVAGLREVIQQVGGNHRPEAVADDDQFAVVRNRVEHPPLDRVAPATARAIRVGIREQQRDPDAWRSDLRERLRSGPGQSGAVAERRLKLAARQPVVARRAPVLIVGRACIGGRRWSSDGSGWTVSRSMYSGATVVHPRLFRSGQAPRAAARHQAPVATGSVRQRFGSRGCTARRVSRRPHGIRRSDPARGSLTNGRATPRRCRWSRPGAQMSVTAPASSPVSGLEFHS